MNIKTIIEILPEDRVKLTKDQKNLIILAIEKQLPAEEAEFLERIQKKAKKIKDPYTEIHEFFIEKYGKVFGTIYLAAITGGEKSFQKAVHDIEESKALKRIKKDNN